MTFFYYINIISILYQFPIFFIYLLFTYLFGYVNIYIH